MVRLKKKKVKKRKKNGCNTGFNDAPCVHCAVCSLVAFQIRSVHSTRLLRLLDLSLPGKAFNSFLCFGLNLC